MSMNDAEIELLVSEKAFELWVQFWKTLKNSAPIYGADVSGTFFDSGVPWNLAEIQTILK